MSFLRSYKVQQMPWNYAIGSAVESRLLMLSVVRIWFRFLMRQICFLLKRFVLMQVSVKVGSEIVPMSVTVLEENEMDLLFGLDMLRRYRCNIDLENNCLRFGSLNVSLPFLPDHEIPKKRPHASMHFQLVTFLPQRYAATTFLLPSSSRYKLAGFLSASRPKWPLCSFQFQHLHWSANAINCLSCLPDHDKS